MSRPTKAEFFLELAAKYSERGTCIRRKAGAVAVDRNNRVVGMGMNGVPRGFPHCTDTPCEGAGDPPGDFRRCMAIHAEINMILNCKDPYEIQIVYLTTSPCWQCALVLANLPNLEMVVYLEKYADGEEALKVLERAHVKVFWCDRGHLVHWEFGEEGMENERFQGLPN